MSSEAISTLIEAMVAGGGSRAESFFLAHGLGNAFNSPTKGWGTQKRVNAALLQAQREDRQDAVVQAGLVAYGLTHLAIEGSETSVPTPATLSKTSRLFISHASADVALADALADLLRLGTDLPSDRILCTSLEGMKIPTGTSDYLEFLRSHLSDAGLVLPLFTPAFFDSEVCLIEIGAMWGMQLPAFPLIVPPVNYARVEKLLGKVQAARIDHAAGLSELHDRLVDIFGLKAKTPMWNSKREQFEAKLPGLLASLASSTRVSAADLESAKKKAAKSRAKAKALELEVDELRERLTKVTAAKTQEMFKEATQPSGTAMDQFEAAVEAARDSVRNFRRVVREAIYEELGQGDYYRPETYSSDVDDAEDAVRADLLKYSEDDAGYYLNQDDPAMAEAVEAITELFDRDWGDEVDTWFVRTYKKRFSIKVRPVWDALDLI